MRAAKQVLALIILAICLIFAVALGGGLIDERAFTPEAVNAPH